MDENHTDRGTSSNLTIDSVTDMNDTYRTLNLPIPTNADEPATKQCTDSHFFFQKWELSNDKRC